MENYDWVTNKMFDKKLVEILDRMEGEEILHKGSAYDVFSEALNNQVLDELEADRKSGKKPYHKPKLSKFVSVEELEGTQAEARKWRDALIDSQERWTKAEKAVLGMMADIKENSRLKREVSELLQEQRVLQYAIEHYASMWLSTYPRMKSSIEEKLREGDVRDAKAL